MINITEKERELIVDCAVAYAHMLSVSRAHRNQPYNYPCDDAALLNATQMLRFLQEKTGIEMVSNNSLDTLITVTSQLVAIQEEEKNVGSTS